jgi:hypothetical protein
MGLIRSPDGFIAKASSNQIVSFKLTFQQTLEFLSCICLFSSQKKNDTLGLNLDLTEINRPNLLETLRMDGAEDRHGSIVETLQLKIYN